MNLTFVFWVTSVYTVVLFGLQIHELLTGQPPFNFSALNAGYLGLMSAYVGGKEITRWSRKSLPAGSSSDSIPAPSRSFRLPGEWFVGGWVGLFLTATLLLQFYPDRFTFPAGLNTIALEVLTFYLGTNVSRWLKSRDVETQAHLEKDLELTSGASSPLPSMARRVSKKRQRFEEKIIATIRRTGAVTRASVQKLTGLKESAAGALLSSMVSRGLLKRIGEVGSIDVRYEI